MTGTAPAITNDHMHHDTPHAEPVKSTVGEVDGTKDQGHMRGMFLVKKNVDGYIVNFHAMKAKEAMQHGGTHNLMVKVEKYGKILTDLMVNSKVTHPNGKSESKMLMKMGDWYMTGYNLGHHGKHQLMVLFKTTDGKKHFGGVYYPEEKTSPQNQNHHRQNHHEQHNH